MTTSTRTPTRSSSTRAASLTTTRISLTTRSRSSHPTARRGFTPTALEDGLIFSLEQGDDDACDAPCTNTLSIRAVDAAGRTSPAVTVEVREDSTLPVAPTLGPRFASITANDVRLALTVASVDNGGAVQSYEVVGGDIPSFTSIGASDSFRFTLPNDDTSNELCVRGKDAAGNVSTSDCVLVEQRRLVDVATTGIDERSPDIAGDIVVYTELGANTAAFDLGTQTRAVLDVGETRGPPRVDADRDEARIVWSAFDEFLVDDLTFLHRVDLDNSSGGLAIDPVECVATCGSNIDEHLTSDISGDNIVIFGNEAGSGAIYTIDVADCAVSTEIICASETSIATKRVGGTGDARTLCEDTTINIDGDTIVWCEDAGTEEVHRFIIGQGETIIANNVQPGEAGVSHQPVGHRSAHLLGERSQPLSNGQGRGGGRAIWGLPGGQRGRRRHREPRGRERRPGGRARRWRKFARRCGGLRRGR